ncbi:MAG: hypothetical protein PUF37_01030 [Prevotellaceae bacterium]|nr:hypothetical protein [Prevotellaceae bacterium]
MTVDPLADIHMTVENFDVERTATAYYNNLGTMAWTTAYFNGREKAEPAVQVPVPMVLKLLQGIISRDEWLSRFFPKQMAAYHKAIEESRRMLLGM